MPRLYFCCDGKARAALVASWYRQLGYGEVYALDGGTGAWVAAGRPLESGLSVGAAFDGSIGGDREPELLVEARGAVRTVSSKNLRDDGSGVTLFVDTSRDFARGHVPGARWVPRGWLEWQVGDFAPSTDTRVVVTCGDGRQSLLAAATLMELGYSDVAALEGGMIAWSAAGLPVEEGLSGVMRTPGDIVFSGPDRSYADMQHYLRWETELGFKYAVGA